MTTENLMDINPTQSDNFIPKSIIETHIEDIQSRRAERDIDDLDIQVCIRVDEQDPDVAEWKEQLPKELWNEVKIPQGKLFCLHTRQQGQEQFYRVETLPETLRQRLSKHSQDTSSELLNLPEDLKGFVFHVAPLPPLPARDDKEVKLTGDRMVLNGDGMVYRLGFESGKATLKTRITKPPCYYADLATQYHPEYQKFCLRFVDGGLARHSLSLGTRNQLNTAFLPIKERLLVTFDAGRPYEIDPNTLEIVEPVGSSEEWIDLLPKFPPSLRQFFRPYSNPAHPVCDCNYSEDKLFSANFSQGLGMVNRINQLRIWVLQKILREYDRIPCNSYWLKPLGNFTDLLRYNFKNGKIQRLRLVLPSGEPVFIHQAIHQMAMTKDYIILGDIAFKMELSQIFAPLIFGCFRKIASPIGYWISLIFLQLVEPFPFTNLYIISRKELDGNFSKKAKNQDSIEELAVKKVTLPREVSHFTADYENPGGKIILHAGHNNGWDATEWIGYYDESVAPKHEKTPLQKRIVKLGAKTIEFFLNSDLLNKEKNRKCLRTELIGIQAGSVDLGSLARYEIDGKTGALLNVKAVSEPGSKDSLKNTWSLSVYTHRNLSRDSENESAEAVAIKNIYWMSWGFSWELIPKRIYRAYRNRDTRSIPYEHLPHEDRPMSLLRLDTEKMKIVDSFEFPIGCFARTPQFVPSSQPCPPGVEASTHGYIVCMVLADDEKGRSKDEFWIFHADDFKGKPVYRLSHWNDLKVSLGLTIHSTWLPSISKLKNLDSSPQEKRKSYIDRDYRPLLQWKFPQTKKLFEEIVFKHFIEQTPEEKLLEIFQQQEH